jgi:hypothetical protein
MCIITVTLLHAYSTQLRKNLLKYFYLKQATWTLICSYSCRLGLPIIYNPPHASQRCHIDSDIFDHGLELLTKIHQARNCVVTREN